MKKILYTIFLFSLIAFHSNAQNEVVGNLSEAKSSYNSGDLENARFALQQSLVELDQIIGEEILKLLPKQVLQANQNAEDDNVSGSMLGYAGVYVHRSYSSENLNSNIEIITNSPFLGMVNSFLTNPLLQGMAGDKNQKVVKIQGYKSLLTKKDDVEKLSYDLQIPISDSMITLTIDGVKSENDVLQVANSLDISAISKLIKGN